MHKLQYIESSPASQLNVFSNCSCNQDKDQVAARLQAPSKAQKHERELLVFDLYAVWRQRMYRIDDKVSNYRGDPETANLQQVSETVIKPGSVGYRMSYTA